MTTKGTPHTAGWGGFAGSVVSMGVVVVVAEGVVVSINISCIRVHLGGCVLTFLVMIS